MTHWRLRWRLAFFSNKVFLMKLCTLFFFLDIMLLHINRLQYSVNINFICTGKQKNLCDSPYFIMHFIAVVWNPAYIISEVWLYSVLGISHVYRRYTYCKTSVCFSPVNLSFILSQEPRSVEGNLLFLPYRRNSHFIVRYFHKMIFKNV